MCYENGGFYFFARALRDGVDKRFLLVCCTVLFVSLDRVYAVFNGVRLLDGGKGCFFRIASAVYLSAILDPQVLVFPFNGAYKLKISCRKFENSIDNETEKEYTFYENFNNNFKEF